MFFTADQLITCQLSTEEQVQMSVHGKSDNYLLLLDTGTSAMFVLIRISNHLSFLGRNTCKSPCTTCQL